MLQFAAEDQTLIPSLLHEAKPWRSMPELESSADLALQQLRTRRRELAQRNWHKRLLVALDERLRTDQAEHLDDPDYPDAKKVDIVQALHRLNRTVGAYKRFLEALQPYIHDIHQREGRPIRLLELASGSGEFSLALAAMARDHALPLTVTGSDYVQAYVQAANDKAAARQLPVSFQQLNAFDMRSLEPGSFDLIFIAQSMHHFNAGQLAMMVAQSMHVASTAFLGIDGERSLRLLAAMPSFSLISRRLDYLHDSWLSVRKLYTQSELELIAHLAAPASHVHSRPVPPGYTLLTVAH